MYYHNRRDLFLYPFWFIKYAGIFLLSKDSYLTTLDFIRFFILVKNPSVIFDIFWFFIL